MAQQDNHSYEFGRFRLKPAERVLLREGEPVPLTPKVFDILVTLVEHGGHVVAKDDLALYETKVKAAFTPAQASWLENGRLIAGDPATLD